MGHEIKNQVNEPVAFKNIADGDTAFKLFLPYRGREFFILERKPILATIDNISCTKLFTSNLPYCID